MSSTSGRRLRALLDLRRWSLLARLTLFFGGAIAAIVLCVSAMMYRELVSQLHEKQEAELQEDLQAQQAVLAGASAKNGQLGVSPASAAQPGDNAEFSWQILDAAGRVLAASQPPAGVEMPANAPRSKGFARFRSGGSDRGKAVLVLESRFANAAGAQVLRGILDISQDEQIVRQYLAKLLLVLVSAIAASVLIGWLLARRGLAPLRMISAEIGRIGAAQLDRRIAQQAWPAELRSLAETFDGLMGRIERAFTQLSQFSSDLAHEFRSPINNLVAAASVTLGRARSAEEYQKTLEVVIQEGNRLSRMVSSMLFLARAENAQQSVRKEWLSTKAEFTRLLDFFGILAEEQDVTLESEGDDQVYADASLLRQAVSNLLANALRYTPCGGTVCMYSRGQENGVVIGVRDNGAGIAAEHLPFLFDRFYRADTARSSVDSCGLGLAVVRSIAELHGGSVSVHSILGKGSTFEVAIPTAPVAPTR